MTREDDVKLALDLGVDYIGFIVYPKSPRYVTPSQLEKLFEFVPPSKRVIVDVETGTDQLEEYLDWQAAAYQIHFGLDVSMATVASWSGLCGIDRFWVAPKVPPKEPFPQVLMEFADSIMLDAYSKTQFGGTGIAKTNWQFFLDCSMMYQHKKWILAGGLGAHNLHEALRFTNADQVDLNSGIEIEAGIKDHNKMKAAIKVIAEFDNEPGD